MWLKNLFKRRKKQEKDPKEGVQTFKEFIDMKSIQFIFFRIWGGVFIYDFRESNKKFLKA